MKRVCSYCGRIVDSETHDCPNKPKDMRRGRQLAKESTRWKKLKADVKARDLCCKLCWYKGLYNPIEEVHHIIPREVQDDETHVFNADNCVGLCMDCHHEIHNEGWKKYSKLLQQLIKEEK